MIERFLRNRFFKHKQPSIEDQLKDTRLEKLGNAWHTLVRPLTGLLILTAALGVYASATGHPEIVPTGLNSISMLLTANWIFDAVKKVWSGPEQFSKKQLRQIDSVLQKNFQELLVTNQINEDNLYQELESTIQRISAQLMGQIEILKDTAIQEHNDSNRVFLERFATAIQNRDENIDQQISLLEQILEMSGQGFHDLNLKVDNVSIQLSKDKAEEQKQLKRNLIAELGSRDNAVATLALAKLRANGWGFDDDESLFDQWLVKANLQGADFSYANLKITNLSDCNLSGSYFGYASLHSCVFKESDMRDTIFYQTEIRKSSFEKANLQRADFREAYWGDTREIWEASFKDADLTDADLEDVRFFGCDFSGAVFTRANLMRTVFSKCNLRGAQFLGTDFSRTFFHDF